MDPQQRVLLELAWAALENAGHMPESFDGAIGVFAGKYNDSYWSENVVTRPDLVDALGTFQSMVANEKDYVATRIAHRLDLTGPAVSIHTACSTSLVTIASAVRSLQAGDCDLALAGGVSITVPVKSGYLYQEGAMLSDDGRTRTFDADARGTVFSDGAGLVVLRRLEDAVRDGDTIWAVIRGVAINNDGGGKASFTAPSIEGQATVVARAHADAGIDPRTIGYVEAHGTATPLGDPIEVEALTRAFRSRTSDVGFCGIGSIKSNFGHSVIAAGVAGVIKTALAFTHEQIPATLFYKAPNPKIDFATSPFRVISELTPWPRSETPRRAGVSSFGVGGTNAHAVLEEAPRPLPSQPSRAKQLLLVSARWPSRSMPRSARSRTTWRRTAIRRASPTSPSRCTWVAAPSAIGARWSATRPWEPSRSFERPRPGRARGPPPRLPRQVVFLFPGQGAQYVGMGRALYEEEPVFREALDQCAELLRPHLELDLGHSRAPGRRRRRRQRGRAPRDALHPACPVRDRVRAREALGELGRETERDDRAQRRRVRLRGARKRDEARGRAGARRRARPIDAVAPRGIDALGPRARRDRSRAPEGHGISPSPRSTAHRSASSPARPRRSRLSRVASKRTASCTSRSTPRTRSTRR